jgi:hypothetical protein
MKASKASVDYGPGHKDGDHCGICKHFEPPHTCEVVAGEVRALGWCKRFVKRSKPVAKGWIKKAVPKAHEGKFTEKAKRAGKTVHEYAEEKKGASGTLGKEARLALTFEGMAHPAKKKSRLSDFYKKKG